MAPSIMNLLSEHVAEVTAAASLITARKFLRCPKAVTDLAARKFLRIFQPDDELKLGYDRGRSD